MTNFSTLKTQPDVEIFRGLDKKLNTKIKNIKLKDKPIRCNQVQSGKNAYNGK